MWKSEIHPYYENAKNEIKRVLENIHLYEERIDQLYDALSIKEANMESGIPKETAVKAANCFNTTAELFLGIMIDLVGKDEETLNDRKINFEHTCASTPLQLTNDFNLSLKRKSVIGEKIGKGGSISRKQKPKKKSKLYVKLPMKLPTGRKTSTVQVCPKSKNSTPQLVKQFGAKVFMSYVNCLKLSN